MRVLLPAHAAFMQRTLLLSSLLLLVRGMLARSGTAMVLLIPLLRLEEVT